MSTAEHVAFALDLHRAIAPDTTTDTCWSPYSVASALGLASQAAGGQTRAELLRLLTGDPATDFAKQADLLASAATLDPPRAGARDAPVLAVSNTLWAQDELPINSSFTVDLAAWPGARIASAPFVRDPDGARRMINEDVAATTHQLIPELIPPGAVRDDTVAALVNALYLRVAWRHRFTEYGRAPFATPDGAAEVPMMGLTEQVGYAAVHGWQAVSLPAEGGVEAVILLPDGKLTRAEPTLDAARLSELLNAPEPARVELRMPKLRIRVNTELMSALTGLGVRSLFTPAGDLSGMSPDPRLTMSSVLHEAVLDVDEEGIEGAAATAAIMRLVSMPTGTPVQVRVDRPFLFAVRHTRTGMLYFLSRVAHPG